MSIDVVGSEKDAIWYYIILGFGLSSYTRYWVGCPLSFFLFKILYNFDKTLQVPGMDSIYWFTDFWCLMAPRRLVILRGRVRLST